MDAGVSLDAEKCVIVVSHPFLFVVHLTGTNGTRFHSQHFPHSRPRDEQSKYSYVDGKSKPLRTMSWLWTANSLNIENSMEKCAKLQSTPQYVTIPTSPSSRPDSVAT